MNPFDLPPSGAPAQLSAPDAVPGPRRGRMALVAVLTAGLIGGGIAGVSQFASADQPELAATAPDESDETIPPADDAEPTDEAPEAPPTPDEDGEIVIDVGDGDPIVLDLDDFDAGAFDRLHECLGLPDFDLDLNLGDWEPGEGPFGDLDELLGDDFFENLPTLDDLDGQFGGFQVFEDGGSVTIAGPDGVSVVDLGENGSVTVTKNGDDVTIETDGDATVQQLDELFGDVGRIFDGPLGEDFELRMDEFLDGLPAFDDDAFDEFLEGLPAFDELPEIEPLDPEQVEQCVADLRGG